MLVRGIITTSGTDETHPGKVDNKGLDLLRGPQEPPFRVRLGSRVAGQHEAAAGGRIVFQLAEKSALELGEELGRIVNVAHGAVVVSSRVSAPGQVAKELSVVVEEGQDGEEEGRVLELARRRHGGEVVHPEEGLAGLDEVESLGGAILREAEAGGAGHVGGSGRRRDEIGELPLLVGSARDVKSKVLRRGAHPVPVAAWPRVGWHICGVEHGRGRWRRELKVGVDVGHVARGNDCHVGRQIDGADGGKGVGERASLGKGVYRRQLKLGLGPHFLRQVFEELFLGRVVDRIPPYLQPP